MLAALKDERDAATQAIPFSAVAARRDGEIALVELEPIRNSRPSTALDESLEGAQAVWSDDRQGRGEVVVVDPDRAEVALRYVQGELPAPNQVVRLYPKDFLSPLIDVWTRPDAQSAALAVLKRNDETLIAPVKPLPSAFGRLRRAQAAAMSLPLRRVALVVGPPGTGKTTTVGAITANLLRRFPKARVLLVGPTNVAVDTALLAADDWLAEIGRDDIRSKLRRVGSRFDTRKFAGRDHLFEPGLYAASVDVAMIELEEPPRSPASAYEAWKDRLDAARAKLKTAVEAIVRNARLVALTTATAARYYDQLSEPKWDFIIADEASQILLPAALSVSALGRNVLFAGDPMQLAPIVKSHDPSVQKLLSQTAFDRLSKVESVFLNEQSRMAHAICDVVSTTFYEGRLVVCPKARRDAVWRKEREPWFINGREVPRVLIDDRAGEATWSSKYNGMIRFRSAQIVEALVAELLGSYVGEDEMLILTPFRAQRALIRSMLRRYGSRGLRVSTVHRSQGTENKIVIFDPVDGGGSFLSGDTGRRLLNVAASRAQAHLVMTIGPGDLRNPLIARMQKRASALWDTAGSYATPFRVSLPSVVA